jgi:hypothetical protein
MPAGTQEECPPTEEVSGRTVAHYQETVALCGAQPAPPLLLFKKT